MGDEIRSGAWSQIMNKSNPIIKEFRLYRECGLVFIMRDWRWAARREPVTIGQRPRKSGNMRDGVRYKRLGSYLEFGAHPVPGIMLSTL